MGQLSIRAVARAEREAVLALLEPALRPPGAPTRIWEDFPVALGEDNCDGIRVLEERGTICAALSCLVRDFVTSLGVLKVAVIGSVVTLPAWRGRGLSRRLQAATIDRLRGQGVPLAVLWSDRPSLYAGRGFRAAGWEHHFDLAGWRPAQARAEWCTRDYQPCDLDAVAALYTGHPYHTRRAHGDAARLYGMPGTRGLVLEVPGAERPAAYLFCNKGLDFPGYVLEWGGPPELVSQLLVAARRHLGARRVLVPAGGEELGRILRAGGARGYAVPSGLWSVLLPAALAANLPIGRPPPPQAAWGDPTTWLGQTHPDGRVTPGPCCLAVWGFDSA